MIKHMGATIQTNSAAAIPRSSYLGNSQQECRNVGLSVIKPWFRRYVEATRDESFGDAVWARCPSGADLENEIAGDSKNLAVLDFFKEDALG